MLYGYVLNRTVGCAWADEEDKKALNYLSRCFLCWTLLQALHTDDPTWSSEVAVSIFTNGATRTQTQLDEDTCPKLLSQGRQEPKPAALATSQGHQLPGTNYSLLRESPA
jgi:hypothetical protein